MAGGFRPNDLDRIDRPNGAAVKADMKRPRFKEIDFSAEQLRQLQLIQLEILKEVDQICRKHGLKYSLDGGTLLGAVRHQGFIPWDDDIDVIMMRNEYERFFEICQTELDLARFFLQEHRTDPYYRVGYTRIRRNHSVYIRAGHEKMKYHTGVFIDLFVLDNVPDRRPWRILHRALCFGLRKILWSASGRVVSDSFPLRLGYGLVSLIPAQLAFGANNILARWCNRKKTSLVRHNTMTYPNPKVCGYGTPADLMGEFTELEFEGQRFMAVADYDRYLTLLYEDYMTLPPPEKRKTHIHLSAFAPVSSLGGKTA
jgi:lipopolysaccharide cholinephosphotransferase